MTQWWEVVGGKQCAGIIVRDGRDTRSIPYDRRLATGSLVEELELVEGRLKFRLVEGSGPNSGWVSVKLNDVSLLVKKEFSSKGVDGVPPVTDQKGNSVPMQKVKETVIQREKESRHSLDSQSSTECPQSRHWSAPAYESCRSSSSRSVHWEMPQEYYPLQEKYSIVLDSRGDPKELGRGSYGVVYQGSRKEDGMAVAIKAIKHGSKKAPWIAREVEVLRRVSDHPSIAKFLEYFDSDSNSYSFVVTELCQGGDLWQYVKEHGPLSEDRARQYLAQLLDAVEYIHCHGVVHRDLKQENIMLDEAGVLKVIDFGLSRICQLRTSRTTGNLKQVLLRGTKGTPGCMAPEVLEGRYQGPEADMWALAVILYEMLTGINPFQSKSSEDLAKNAILRGRYNTTAPAFCKLSTEAKQLFEALFAVKPKQRLTIQQLRESDWMCSISTEPESSCYCSPWATMPQRFEVLEDIKQDGLQAGANSTTVVNSEDEALKGKQQDVTLQRKTYEAHIRKLQKTVDEERINSGKNMSKVLSSSASMPGNRVSKESRLQQVDMGKARFPTLHQKFIHVARHNVDMKVRLGK